MRVYDHLEKHGRQETDGIDMGEVFIYPKIDGTNARVDLDENYNVRAGSRKRIITPEDDNAGFAAWVVENESRLEDLIVAIATARQTDSQNVTVYGEWLVPHTLKTYRDDAWRKFYIFDVHIEGVGYLHPDHWQGVAMRMEFEVIRPLQIANNPSVDQLVYAMNEHNTFLVKDGEGLGEGIVLKNYRWQNQWGRQPWAKMVRNEFKERHGAAMGPPELQGTKMVELEIAAECVTRALVEKEIAKIELDWGEQFEMEPESAEPCPRKVLIPRLLSTIFHCVVTEDMWAMVKKHKNPKVDFKKLQQACIMRTKELAPELF